MQEASHKAVACPNGVRNLHTSGCRSHCRPAVTGTTALGTQADYADLQASSLSGTFPCQKVS